MSDSTQSKPEVIVRDDEHGLKLQCKGFEIWLIDGALHLEDYDGFMGAMATETFLALADALRTKLEGPALRKVVGYIDLDNLGILTDEDFEEGTEVEIRTVTP